MLPAITPGRPLGRVVGAIASALADGGLFAFSVELLSGSDDFALRPSRRCAHSQIYVRRILAASGFSILSLESVTLRHDRREPVQGLTVVAEKFAGVPL